MTVPRLLPALALALALVALVGATAASGAPSAEPFTLVSPAFPPNGRIPVKHSCDGAGARPVLKWKGAPKGTRGFALLVDDPDAQQASFIKPDELVGEPFVYWLGWNIRAAATSISGPAPAEGKNDAGTRGWTPICPQEPGVHGIRFRLYALSAPITLKPGAGVTPFESALRGKVLSIAKLVGRYG